jgi:hypothetical protein
MYLARLSLGVVRRKHQNRTTEAVAQEYSEGWRQYERYLTVSDSLGDWLNAPKADDAGYYFNRKGKLAYGNFNSGLYYRETLIAALRSHFPNAKSITEFGAGVGRNLLYLKREIPSLDAYGYELCTPGVDIARAAAAKFGLSVHYAPLDYLNDPPEKFVFPDTDVAFTMFSLEQIPARVSTALQNILSRSRLGSIHIEPVPENYPVTFRGVLGRIDHWKVDYLSGFDQIVHAVRGVTVEVEPMASSHNPLMFPSIYILKKH